VSYFFGTRLLIRLINLLSILKIHANKNIYFLFQCQKHKYIFFYVKTQNDFFYARHNFLTKIIYAKDIFRPFFSMAIMQIFQWLTHTILFTNSLIHTYKYQHTTCTITNTKSSKIQITSPFGSATAAAFYLKRSRSRLVK
jgi:hypothetical protein